MEAEKRTGPGAMSSAALPTKSAIKGTHGPGTLNKYTTVNYTPVLVNYRQRKGNRLEDGRDIFCNHNNPYQFDKTTLMRQLCVEQKIGERRAAEDAKWAEEMMATLPDGARHTKSMG